MIPCAEPGGRSEGIALEADRSTAVIIVLYGGVQNSKLDLRD